MRPSRARGLKFAHGKAENSRASRAKAVENFDPNACICSSVTLKVRWEITWHADKRRRKLVRIAECDWRKCQRRYEDLSPVEFRRKRQQLVASMAAKAPELFSLFPILNRYITKRSAS